jgi:Tfp pilus assembly protein PilF
MTSGISPQRPVAPIAGRAFGRSRAVCRILAALSAPAALALVSAATAAPYRPQSDQQVLEKLPARAADPRMRELSELRRAWQSKPQDLDVAVRLARRYYEQVAAEGDPRYIGYAQAALAPWWNLPDPPVAARVMRAIILQFGHQFDAARADLAAAVKQDPANAEAWAWSAAIDMVQARYPEARAACQQLTQHASSLIGTTCVAYVDSVTGRASVAAESIRSALRENPKASAGELLWVLTRLAEIEDRLGDSSRAEETYRRALGLQLDDGYLLAAYADFLLDRGRPAEVLVLLKDSTRSDVLLLRLALAAKALNAPTLAGWEHDLAARFDAATLRVDKLHQKEEARFALGVQGQASKALALARENYALQREPADARVLLEAALAAGQPTAAEPVLQWMAASGIESAALSTLARKLKGGS